jgi:cytochrome c oxidase assembly factor CtaG
MVVLLVASAVWYALGLRAARRRSPWRAAAFYAGLVSILLALSGPVDRLSDTLLWAHMVQHLLLMLVAAPLLVLGAPWLPFWRPLPLGFKRRVAGAVVRDPALGPVRSAARWLAIPVVAWVLFNGDLALWHVPALYDLTERSTPVHYVEHLSFLALAMLFWAQVIDSPPFHSRLGEMERVAYLTAGAIASWILAVVLALAPTPFYSAYSSILPRPEGLSALTDQQLAGGMMWGPGSIPYAIGVFWLLYVWLGDEEARLRRPRRHVAASGAAGSGRDAVVLLHGGLVEFDASRLGPAGAEADSCNGREGSNGEQREDEVGGGGHGVQLLRSSDR